MQQNLPNREVIVCWEAYDVGYLPLLPTLPTKSQICLGPKQSCYSLLCLTKSETRKLYQTHVIRLNSK